MLSFGNFPGGVFGGENCADVQGGSLANSTPVNAYNCTAAPNQQFEFSGNTIYALGGQRCLDIESANENPAAGDLVDSYPCNGGVNQQWAYSATGSGAGRIQPAGDTSLCLDATTGTNGTQLEVNNCDNTPSQQWQIKATVLSFGDFPGNVFGGENCADVQDGSPANSTPVNAYDCTAAPNQQFEFSGNTIYALGGQTCLNIASANENPAAGDLVDSYPCNGGGNQQWNYENGQIIHVTPGATKCTPPGPTTCYGPAPGEVTSYPAGTPLPSPLPSGEVCQIGVGYCIISSASSLCLDASTEANGTQLVVDNCNTNAPSQEWQLK